MYALREALQLWYSTHKRDLPWRHTQDPYAIWLSEIILQQTRVDQGLPYYHRFISTFPTVNDLAQATQQEVLNLWQGLGYYSRGRNLHATAQQIIAEYNGVFPETYPGLLKLKGIGPYTAAAIASFAFNLPHAVLDGNVFRVLSRYFGIDLPINATEGKVLFEQLANELLDRHAPALHNQAIMEFGALQCKPVSPNCKWCPVSDSCAALKANKVDILPIKLKKTKIKERFFVYHVITNQQQQIAFQQRGPKDIWEGLFEFPLREFEDDDKAASYLQDKTTIGAPYKHVLTHQKITAYFIADRVENWPQNNFLFLDISNLNAHPIPRLIDKFLDTFVQNKLDVKPAL
ncbi:MAG: A/G-specific adenine glycosylase [Sphingomonadales bacterium]